MNRRQKQDVLPAFISTQVTEARRFFLNLKPNHQSELEVVCGGVERMRPDYFIDRSDFPYFGIELVTEGAGSLTIHGKRHQLSAGVMFAYGPGIEHTIRNRADDGMRKYYVDFVGTQASRLLSDAGLMTKRSKFDVLSVGAIHELIELFEMLIRNSNEDGPMVTPICKSLLSLMALKTAQLRLSGGKSVPRSYATYERIRRHIDRRYITLQTIQAVADECDVTPVYLSRLFSRFSDCGAHQYLIRRKMNYAAGLLMNEGLLVQEVAKRLGMPDPFQFSRAFKRVFGIPPSQLVRSPNDGKRTKGKNQ